MRVESRNGFFFFSSRRRHTRCSRDWSSDVCSSDLGGKTYRAPQELQTRGGGLLTRFRVLLVGAGYVFARLLARIGRRSEERHVGKECRARWAPDHEKKKEMEQECEAVVEICRHVDR